jgi:type 1 fimbria pilin
MNNKKMMVGLGLLLCMSGTCFAGAGSAGGIIRIQGQITESPCHASTESGGLTSLYCSSAVRAGTISARSVEPALSISSLEQREANVKLINQRDDGKGITRQQVVVLDANDQPIQTGKYLITVAYP